MIVRGEAGGVPDLNVLDSDLTADPIAWLERATDDEVLSVLGATLGTGSVALANCMARGYQHPNGIQVVKVGILGGSKQMRLHIFGGPIENPAATRHTHAWGQHSRVLKESVLDTTYDVALEGGPHHLYEARSPILSGTSQLIRTQSGVECSETDSGEYGEGSVRYQPAGIYHAAYAAGSIQPITVVINDETGADRTPLVVGMEDLGDKIVVPRRPLDQELTAEGLQRLGLI